MGIHKNWRDLKEALTVREEVWHRECVRRTIRQDYAQGAADACHEILEMMHVMETGETGTLK